MHAKLEELLVRIKYKYGEDSQITFDIDNAWHPREPFVIMFEYNLNTTTDNKQFYGTTFGQALTKLEDFING